MSSTSKIYRSNNNTHHPPLSARYGGQNGAWQIIDALRDEAADADSGLQ